MRACFDLHSHPSIPQAQAGPEVTAGWGPVAGSSSLKSQQRKDGSHVVIVAENTRLATVLWQVLFCALSTNFSTSARRSFSYPLLTRAGGLPAMTSPEKGWHCGPHTGCCYALRLDIFPRKRTGGKDRVEARTRGTPAFARQKDYQKELEKRMRSQRGKTHSTCALRLNGFQLWSLFGSNYKNVQCAR